MINIREYTDEFHPDDLVTWHESYENKSIPVPGVVIRQEPDSIIIKARVQERYNQPGSLELKISRMELLEEMKSKAFSRIRVAWPARSKAAN